MKKLIVLLLLISIGFGVEGQNFPNDTLKNLDQFIFDVMNESGMPGLAAAIIVDNRVVFQKAYGYADIRSKQLFRTETVHGVASITKAFTGVCVMKAVEMGLLSLDEDINKYLPFKVINPYFPGEVITIRHLATHTSSIADRESVYAGTYYKGGDPSVKLGDFLKDYFMLGGKTYSSDNFYKHKPGEYHEYSNIAVSLAGYIVEVVSGQRLDKFAFKHIHKPLDLKNTSWFLNSNHKINLAKLYKKEQESLVEIPYYGSITYPDGAIRTNIKELTVFFNMLLNGGKHGSKRILKHESVSEMFRLQFTEMKKPENLDISKRNEGVFLKTKFNATRIGYGGNDPGIIADMLTTLDKRVSVIMFTNISGENPEVLRGYGMIYTRLFKVGASMLK